MIKFWQIAALSTLAAVLWAGVTYHIRAHPAVDPRSAAGLAMFATAPLAGLLSVGLCKLVGRLSPEQLLTGVSVVGAVAMMMDGVALQYFPGLYGFDETALRIGAGGLLWGYGVAFAAALTWIWVAASRRNRRRTSPS